MASATPVPSTNHWPHAMANETMHNAKTRMLKKAGSIPGRPDMATLTPETTTQSVFANQLTPPGSAMNF